MNAPIRTTSKVNCFVRTEGVGVIAILLLLPVRVNAQSDDFSDGNDVGWTHYAPLASYGIPTSYTFSNGGYRIQTTAATGNPANPGRAGSIREDVSYTDFYLMVDMVSWNDDLREAFGLVARVGSPGLGTTTGYSFTYDRGSVSPTSGGFYISRIVSEDPTTISTGANSLHLDPAKDYRFLFIGKGSALEGRVYELPNTTTPLLTLTASDSTYTSGNSGLVVFDNSGGNGLTDATFDNYFAASEEPPVLTLVAPGGRDIMLTWPLRYTGFILQGSATFPPTWVDIESGTDYGTGSWIVVENTASGNKFYRLVK